MYKLINVCITPIKVNIDMDHSDNVDFAFLITDDEEKPVEIDLTSDQEEDLINDLSDDDVDIYEGLSLVLLANDQTDPLDYEELSDLSEDEFMEERAGSASEEPAASTDGDNSPQELEFSEEDLLEADYSELTSIKPSYQRQLATSGTATPPSSPASQKTEEVEMEWQGRESPTSCAAAEVPCEVEAAAVQGCDPAVMNVSQKQLDDWVAELPFPPLEATLRRWRERTASPSMMEYVKRRRRDLKADGQSIYIPYNLRDILNAKKERDLAQRDHA